jgi:hypothetical protein
VKGIYYDSLRGLIAVRVLRLNGDGTAQVRVTARVRRGVFRTGEEFPASLTFLVRKSRVRGYHQRVIGLTTAEIEAAIATTDVR